ncbi:XrtA system polysaccharide chain length determinant [uncultured Desulfosarcina sp.]|uniref:XrtA system polysaccharide chain length determinant n=1 Tax=uncultured Desulfosarcina sp. TaxID=218289 RepID=UPI0029C6C85D|nr:XrtA system polysaccharide chain length determinant [uncultured Desulfosarcina sp.]
MASQPIPMDPKYIIDLIIKRRWIIIVPFVLAMVVGNYLAITLPRVYEASTLILIQPQRVPQNYVQSIVSTDPSERISTLSQQVLSRTNLEKLIQEFNLFQDDERSNMYMEDKLKSLRNRISIDVSRDRRGNDAFTISYQDKDPQKTMNVTNALASYFIDENLRLREAQAVGTSDFLDNELQNMKGRLEDVETKFKQYREKFMGELPEQLDSNLRILDRLQERLSENQKSLSEAKIRLASIQNEATALKAQSTTVIIGQNTHEEPTDLDRMKIQLENLLSRYTERHPDVIRLKARIAEMEKQDQSVAQTAPFVGSDGSVVQNQRVTMPPEFRMQYNEVLQEIKRLEVDIEDTQKQVLLYQKRVENTPKREQELLSLRRDYQNIQATYDSLLERKLEAEIAVNMERKQKGEQFRIVDPAKLPEKPIKPNMKKLFIFIVGAGLAIGGGIIFLLEYIDNSFKRPEDIEEDLELPVLCSIPLIISRKTRIIRRFEHAACAVFGCISIALFGVFAILSLKGVEQTLELIRKVGNL